MPVPSVLAPATGFALLLAAFLADQLTHPGIASFALGLLLFPLGLFQPATKRLKH